MKDTKIAIIGAGSLAFSLSLVTDLSLTPGIADSKVVLMDIDDKRLEAIYNLTTRYSRELRSNLSVEKTKDMTEAVKGSDFVINTAFADGYDGLGQMIEEAEKFGYYRGLDATEWNMVNNYTIYTGHKQYKISLDIARAMEDLSPDAWLLQAANPVFELTTMLQRKSRIKSVGFCHGFHAYAGLARAVGLNPEGLDFQVAGLNHDVWLTRLRNEDGDVYPLIDDWLEKKAEDFWTSYVLDVWEEQMSRAAADMYRRYGLYPIGDTTRSGPWTYHKDLKTKQKWYGPVGGVDSEIGWILRLLRNRKNLNRLFSLANGNSDLLKELPPQKSGEQFADFIDCVVNGNSRRLQLNLKNGDTFSFIPADVAVDVPVRVSGDKITIEMLDKIPSAVEKFAIIPRWERMEWALEAFNCLEEGGMSSYREVLTNILFNDVRTQSTEQVSGVMDSFMSLPYNN
jgi:alpha-galactosidase